MGNHFMKFETHLTSESFFRHTLAVIGYVAEVTKNLKNDSLVKCVSNFIKWFVMMINAWDHLDSCIWGWQGGQLTQKNAEFGQNRPFSEVQGQSNDPPDNPKSYRYIYNISFEGVRGSFLAICSLFADSPIAIWAILRV